MIRVPRDVQELSARLTIVRDRLTRELGRSPTVQELAKAAHSGIEQVLEALGAADAYRALSLDQPLGEGIEALDAIGGDDAGFERVEQRQMLRWGSRTCRRASARSCTCASTRDLRSARSPTASACPRCTSRG